MLRVARCDPGDDRRRRALARAETTTERGLRRWIFLGGGLLIVVQVAYFAYHAAGVTQSLWARWKWLLLLRERRAARG